ncbi:MAG: RsmF rRNA methyltransferase first C-terminal domain-containing protein [Clostridium sp.]|nr:RsmF rRNA methyltransferase first C-terminal domain-containing protein [Clostridium sp.]
MELPKTFEANMRALLGDEYEKYEKCLDKPMFHGIRINTMKISVSDFLKINPFHLKAVPWCENGFYYDETLDKPSKHPYYYAGLYYIQEPSAMTPANVLPVCEHDKVLDLCAAPGGKSTELGAKLKGTGLLVSNDISASRAKALLKNIELFGIGNALVISEAPHKLKDRFFEFFDKILIDAPCSGEGMFRKSASMVTAWTDDKNESFAKLQREIVGYAVDMLKPSGKLVYSTCTFSPMENEQSVEYMLSLDERLSLCEFDSWEEFDGGHPEWGNTNNADLKKCVRLWPHRLEGEGHFVCLVKKGNGSKNDCSEHNNAAYGFEKNDKATHDIGSYQIRASRLPDEVTEFFKGMNCTFDFSRFEVSQDKLYYIPACFPEVRGLRILRCGLFVGEIKKNRFEPSQAFAMWLTGDDYKNTVQLSCDDIRVTKYLKGETIEAEGKNGWALVLVDGYPLGWGKLNSGVLKNKYLPGWRLT